jgi:hypothetical protein
MSGCNFIRGSVSLNKPPEMTTGSPFPRSRGFLR